MRVERFVATFALACLCNCATTKPDSTDSPSSLIDLPEQQKQNEDNLTIDGGGGETGETVSETGSQNDTSPDSVPHDELPTTVSEFADSGESQGEDSSVVDQPDAREPKSTPSDSDRSSKPEANETITTVETQSEASDPSSEGKHPFDSKNASDIDEKPIDTDKSLAGNSNAEADTPLADFFTKDSTEDLDPLEVGREEGNPSEPNKTTQQTTLDQTDLEFSGSSEDPENKTSSPDVSLGFSAGDVSSPDEPDNSGNRLVYESENQPESLSSTSPTSNLGFSDANSES
ncbi:MAG: hypothetical protein OSB39_11255, partial [Opitutales bacterium]|nr:hypothetical protein [Opitutales bacterium]